MKDLKELMDRREKLMSTGQSMAEHRDADFDISALKSIQEEIRNLDEEIAQEKKNREESRDNKGEKQMADIKELEVRALDDIIRHGEVSHELMEEVRDLGETSFTEGNSTEPGPGNGGSLVSETVYSQIIPKLDNIAPVFAAAQKYPSVNGRLKVARETSAADLNAGFVGEGVDVNTLTSGFKSVVLDQKRVGGAIQLTNELIVDSAVDIVSYSTERLAKSLARVLEKSILLGSDEGFRGVIADADVKTVDDVEITVESMVDLYNGLHQMYRSQAIWVVSQEAYDVIAKLKDGDGRYLILNNAVMSNQDVFGQTFLGRPIFVSDALKDADKQIVFGAFEGYGLMIKKGMNLTHVTQDSRQALAGGHLIVLDAHMDGAVTNPDMFITAGIADTVNP